MSEEGRALLAEVCERVDDDAVRLVYADWLEEHGGEPGRARAIRLGVERRRLEDLDPRAWVIDSQLRQLHERHGQAWSAGVHRPKGVRAIELSGGLVTKVTVDLARALTRHEDQLFRLGPITELCLTFTDASDPKAVTSCRYAARLRSLRFVSTGWGAIEGLGPLLEADGLRGLRELGLAGFLPDRAAVNELAKARPAARLTALDLTHNLFDEHDCRALARAPFVTELRSLRLKASGYGPRPVALLQGDGWRGLRQFVGHDLIPRDSLNDLPFSSWPELEVLDLSENHVGATAARQLAGAASARRLRLLALSNCTRVGDRGMRALASSPHLGNLRVLKVDYCGLDRKGVEALAGAPWLAGLTSLSVGGCYESAAVCDVLAPAPPGGLRRLELDGSGLSDASVEALLAAESLPGLTHLNLASNGITGKGARALADSALAETLVELDLTRNPFTAADRAHLRDRFGDRVRL